MKTFAISLLLLAVAGELLATKSCRRNPSHDFPVPEANAAEPTSSAAPAIPEDIESSIREKGRAITAQAFGVLSSRLGKAIAEAGYTNAIEFCSVHGITFTTSVGVTNQVALRRVTHRPRNSQNRADTNERPSSVSSKPR